jgi:hypothetical protein
MKSISIKTTNKFEPICLIKDTEKEKVIVFPDIEELIDVVYHESNTIDIMDASFNTLNAKDIKDLLQSDNDNLRQFGINLLHAFVGEYNNCFDDENENEIGLPTNNNVTNEIIAEYILLHSN